MCLGSAWKALSVAGSKSRLKYLDCVIGKYEFKVKSMSSKFLAMKLT